MHPNVGRLIYIHDWQRIATVPIPTYGPICLSASAALQWRMPRDPYIREKFTRLRITARKLAAEYLERFPKDRYLTEIESWRHLQSDNIEFTMKRLREPVDHG